MTFAIICVKLNSIIYYNCMVTDMFNFKKKKKKKMPVERIVSLTANGTLIEAINFSLTKNKDGSPRLEVRTKDVCEALHFDTVDFELKTTNKMVKVSAAFKEAIGEKHFKLYVFDIKDYNQYFI